jgi:hypothetical protein
VCITHYCDSEQLKVVLATPLREEMVERNPILCEPLNEDVGFFVDLNLKIKFCISCALTFTYFSTDIYLLIEHIL